jgi:hypothetical protein
MLDAVQRLRSALDAASDPSPPIYVALFGVTETLAVTAAVIAVAAAALKPHVLSFAAANPDPSSPAQAPEPASLSQLVDVSVARSAMLTVLKVAPELSPVIGAVLEASAPAAVPSPAVGALLQAVVPLAVIAHVPTLAEAAAAAAVGEASDAVARAALRAGAAATFAVPLLRSELVDRLVDALATRALAAEARASAALLKKVLPQRVTDRLKAGVSFYAEAMPSVSILFVDVCQFTVLASVLEPLQIVILLNELFSAFDALMLKYGVFKVESACCVRRACHHASVHSLTHTRVVCLCAHSHRRLLQCVPAAGRVCFASPACTCIVFRH